MLYLFEYLLTGLVLIYGTAFGHLLRAEMKGYKAIEYWSEHGGSMLSQVNNLPLAVVWGLIIWPVRYINMIMSILPEAYNLYDRKFI